MAAHTCPPRRVAPTLSPCLVETVRRMPWSPTLEPAPFRAASAASRSKTVVPPAWSCGKCWDRPEGQKRLHCNRGYRCGRLCICTVYEGIPHIRWKLHALMGLQSSENSELKPANVRMQVCIGKASSPYRSLDEYRLLCWEPARWAVPRCRRRQAQRRWYGRVRASSPGDHESSARPG